MEIWQFCFIVPLIIFAGVVVMGIILAIILWVVARKYRQKNDWSDKGEIYINTIKSNIDRAKEISQIKTIRNNPDKFNPPQPPFKHHGQVDFGDLVGIAINDGSGLYDLLFPPPDRLLLVPTQLVTHRLFSEMVIDCNGWTRIGDLYIPIPRHDQAEYHSAWMKAILRWFEEQALTPQFIMALSNGLESQAKAHQMNPLVKGMLERVADITGVRNNENERN